jgi:phytoene dehydrogenase-like protein
LSSEKQTYDAVIIGSGPNGLAAAIRLALEGLSVKVVEAADTIGGGMRSSELMEPGVHHDICSAIHPMGVSSPFFKKLPLNQYGLRWIHPEYAAAHPLDDEPAAILTDDFFETAFLHNEDEETYKKLIAPLLEDWDGLARDFLAPLRLPDHPLRLASFGLKALQPASLFRRRFKTRRARALFGGMAAHSLLPLNSWSTSALGLVFYAAAHRGGWPLAKGGSQSIADALAGYLKSLGGEIETGTKVTHLSQLPSSKTVLFDITPKQILSIASDYLPGAYKNQLKKFRYGNGVFKLDYILKEPVPWKDPACAKAGTVHLGGNFEEIASSEKLMDEGGHPENPFVLVAQQSLFDDTRTPDDRHTLWAYCHVPNGSRKDMTQAIENQLERFAPGFRDVVEQRHSMNTHDFQTYNANYIGGDINGGRQDLSQLFSRPVSFWNPYSIPSDGLYICSSSTPPGGGVHGMCGYHAATSVLKKEFGFKSSDFSFTL